MANKKALDKGYSTEIAHLSDLTDYIGKELGVSNWMTITQEMINSFANTTGTSNGYMWILKNLLPIPLIKQLWPMVLWSFP